MRFRLFRPAWDSEDERKAIKAVNKLKNEVKLARVAKEAQNRLVREAAVKKITNQKLLADVAVNSKQLWTEPVGMAAVEQITDQNLLAYVAKNDGWVHEEAIKKITDLNILADIAKNAESSSARNAAIKKLTDQKVLVDVAENDKDVYVRMLAAKNLTDQTLAQKVYADIAKSSTTKKQTDPFVAQLASLMRDYYKKNDKYSDVRDVRIVAVERLTEPSILADVAKNAEDSNVRKVASERLILMVEP
jgi:hypothetical protein